MSSKTKDNAPVPSPDEDETDEGIPRSDHVIPGFHVYDGVPYAGVFPESALEGIKNFRFREDDVILVGYPKSGNVWMGQILYLVHSGGVPTDINDVIMKHVSTMEFGAYEGHPASVEVIDGMASPRKMRSHLEATFFKRVIETKKTKFIVIMRNIKDVLVSYYYMHRSLEVLGKFKGSFEEFVGMYKEGRLQDWFDWNLGWWKYREYPNVMFIKYEELKRDLPGQVRRIMKYLNLDPSDDVISRVCQNASFQQMRKDMSKSEVIEGMFDDQVSPFMRKGQVGDWKRHFTPQLNSYIDQIYSERLAGTGLHFEFE